MSIEFASYWLIFGYNFLMNKPIWTIFGILMVINNKNKISFRFVRYGH